MSFFGSSRSDGLWSRREAEETRSFNRIVLLFLLNVRESEERGAMNGHRGVLRRGRNAWFEFTSNLKFKKLVFWLWRTTHALYRTTGRYDSIDVR
jgi:hypothetical protein